MSCRFYFACALNDPMRNWEVCWQIFVVFLCVCVFFNSRPTLKPLCKVASYPFLCSMAFTHNRHRNVPATFYAYWLAMQLRLSWIPHFLQTPDVQLCLKLIHSQIRPAPAEEMQPTKWRPHPPGRGTPRAHPGCVTRPPAAGRSQATCNPQKAQELPRGLGPPEAERFRTRKDDAGGRLLETLFFWWLNSGNNFFT